MKFNIKKICIAILLIIICVFIGIIITRPDLSKSNTVSNASNNTTVTSTTNISNSELSYSTNRSDYSSDEQFSNFRLLKGGNLKPIIYRGASPIDKTYNRNLITDKLLKKNNINYIINLANSEKSFKEMLEANAYSSKYTYFLYKNDKIHFGNLSIKYETKQYAEDMAKALMKITKNEGPFYIHCLHGRDRTGMACIILEAIADASYEEILDDYMKTYDNYNSVNLSTNPDRYNAILNSRFKNAIYYITRDNKINDYSSYNYKKAAEDYLKFGGLTNIEINELKAKITE